MATVAQGLEALGKLSSAIVACDIELSTNVCLAIPEYENARWSRQGQADLIRSWRRAVRISKAHAKLMQKIESTRLGAR